MCMRQIMQTRTYALWAFLSDAYINILSCACSQEEAQHHEGSDSEGATSLPAGGIDRAALVSPGSILPAHTYSNGRTSAADGGQTQEHMHANPLAASAVAGLLGHREAMAVICGAR